MSGFVYSVFGFLLAIAILVAVHEFGHFWVARKLGVKVLKFSIGFGHSLVRWRRKGDDTEYSIGLIPLGGYVKMLDEREDDIDESESHMAFNRQSIPVRSAIVAAGPMFNFIFAIFAIWLVFVIGTDDLSPEVGYVQTESIAEKVGFVAGDKLLAVDGRPVRTWSEQMPYLLHQAMKENMVDVLVEGKDGSDRQIIIDFGLIDQRTISGQSIARQIGLHPTPPPAMVDRIIEGSPASRSGLVKGDVFHSIDGVPVRDWYHMAEITSASPGATLAVEVLRSGDIISMKLVPEKVVVDDKEYGRIGLYMPKPEIIKLQYGWLESIVAAADYNWRVTIINLRSLGRMLTAKMSSENLSGPITIARMAGATVESGWDDFFRFLAVISISLGLLNLLPIPVLDGGHLVYFAIEAVIGRPPSENFMIWGQKIGLVLLLMLMILAFHNDIMRLL